MKKLLLVLSVLLCFAFLLTGCNDNSAESSTKSSVSSSDTVDISSAVESSSLEDSKMQDSIASKPQADSLPEDTPASKPQDVESAPVESEPDLPIESIPESTPESAPEIDKTPEIVYPDGPIDIFADGISKCDFVYDKSDIRTEEFANNLASYIKDTYGVEISLKGYSDMVDTIYSDYRVLIGDVEGVEKAKEKLNSTNDFGMLVSGRDYVLYATNSRLYEYMLEIMKAEILPQITDGSWSTSPEKNFIYHTSSYKDTSYVDYVLKGGTLTQDILLKFFEARTFVASDKTELPYRIYIPYDYDTSKEYPVLTVLHGAGERGNDNVSQMKHMLLDMFKASGSPLWDSIVICPQCPEGQQWVDTPWANGNYMISRVEESNENKAVLEILDMVENEFPTDKERYYITGLSMGGFGVWDLMMRHYDRFAGMVALCGGADFLQAKNLVDKPIWTIHGTNDTTVPISGTSQIVEAIQSFGGTKITYEELEGYGHNVWGYAAAKAEIWTWLYEQTLSE